MTEGIGPLPVEERRTSQAILEHYPILAQLLDRLDAEGEWYKRALADSVEVEPFEAVYRALYRDLADGVIDFLDVQRKVDTKNPEHMEAMKKFFTARVMGRINPAIIFGIWLGQRGLATIPAPLTSEGK